ncbi:DUF4097 family beta strand repeat-containing protein [Niabella ginsengisoli]|uniref:Adhesin domain-containing protein n=1 Tax=Niabella ginsengisoli TaxID=522298 RepID=A0ABS9SI81_9BACT|nr:hypothetical protein [Niabella ginsengisoli]MCH5598064.1 hypothetical protein [Niabella ginsengisoli]
MIKIIKTCSLLLCLLAITTVVAHADNVEKRKTFSKTYSLRSNQKVKISNKFGKVEVNNWNRNEVKVDVTIIASSKDDHATQSILDNINIESSDGNPVTFTTKFSNSNNKTKNSKMEINYVVHMPAGNPLEIKNEFGSTVIPDWEGEVNVNQSFGALTTGKLRNAKDLDVEFGSLTSTAINDGRIKISYSKLKVDNLSGNISSKIDFCKGSTLGLLKTLTKLDMKISYSDVSLDLSSDLEATFKINTSFGNVKNSSNVEIINETKEKKYGPTFDKVYSGRKGSGKVPITISSSFGDVILK